MEAEQGLEREKRGQRCGKDPCLGQSPAESSQLHPGCRHP